MRREEIEVLKAILDEALSYDEDEICLTYDEAVLLTDFFTKLLEQEPCEDAISRQAVLDEMYRRKANGDAITAGFIRGLPSVTPQSKWIPVSERLPEERGVYIVTEKVFSLTDREHTGNFNLMAEQVEFYNGNWQRARFYEVIAWMPLPEPYKAESEE